MESVNPAILVAAGAAVVGVAAVVVCMQNNSKTTTPPPSAESKSTKVDKPKKKTTKDKKKPTKKTSIAAVAVPEENDSDENPQQVVQPIVSKQTDIKAEIPSIKDHQIDFKSPTSPLEDKPESPVAEDEPKKNKKAKETPEQKAARLERQKLAKAKKLEQENEFAPTPITDEFYIPPEILDENRQVQTPQTDGWAVVKTGKVKPAKKAASPVVEVVAAAASATTPTIESVKKEISVDGKKVGVIIGQKGATLKSIQDATGVEITTPKDKDAKMAIIGISGTAEGVEKAERAILDLCSKGYATLLEGEDFSEGHVSILPMYIPHVIGKQGCVRKAIQEHTGVKVSIPDGVSRDQETKVKITLAGQRMKVSEAKRLIKEICQYYHTAVTHPGLVHVEMEVPPNLYNFIIGAKGSEIRHIQGNFKVQVYIPNEQSVTPNVLIVGETVGVQGAQKYIQKIMDQAGKDKSATADAIDAWAEQQGATEGEHEEWMDKYTHPSKRQSTDESTASILQRGGSGNLEPAESVLHAATQSAWSSAVLSSAEGW